MNQHLMTSHLLQIVQDNSKRHDEIAAMKLENQSLRVEVSNLTLQLNEVLQSDERKEKQITDLKKQVEELLNERKYSQREDIDFVETDSVGKVRKWCNQGWWSSNALCYCGVERKGRSQVANTENKCEYS